MRGTRTGTNDILIEGQIWPKEMMGHREEFTILMATFFTQCILLPILGFTKATRKVNFACETFCRLM